MAIDVSEAMAVEIKSTFKGIESEGTQNITSVSYTHLDVYKRQL